MASPQNQGTSWLVCSGMRRAVDIVNELGMAHMANCSGNEAAAGQGGMCKMNVVEEQGMGQRQGGRRGNSCARQWQDGIGELRMI